MPPIEIRRRPIAGDPIHLAGHEHEHFSHDFIKVAPTKISPLAYSLLRAAGFAFAGHRVERAQAAADGFFNAAKTAVEVTKIDRERGERHWRMVGRLYIWDQVQILHEVCEDLAGVFEAVRSTQTDPTIDLGRELLAYHRAADKVIGSPEFAEESWWRKELGVEPDPARFALLTPEQQSALSTVLDGAGARLTQALATIRSTYTHDLHRIAARNRHGMALLEPDQGLAWVGRGEAARRADTEALEAGALAIADIQGPNVVELLMPISIEVFEAIRRCWNEAYWLLQMLCGAIGGRAETPGGVTVPMDNVDTVPAPPGLAEAMLAYTGIAAEDWVRTNWRTSMTDAVYAEVDRKTSRDRAREGAYTKRRTKPKRSSRRR